MNLSSREIPFGLSVIRLQPKYHLWSLRKAASLAACTVVSLLLEEAVNQNVGHADCLLPRGETERTLMLFYILTKRMHQFLDTAPSKMSSHFLFPKPLPASPRPKVLYLTLSLGLFKMDLAFCYFSVLIILLIPPFLFYDLRSVFSVPLLHDTQPSLSRCCHF